MDTLRNDLRFALRFFMRRPGFSAVVVLSLALAIGANTAIFSIVNTVALGDVDIPEADRVVALYTLDEKNPGHLPVSDLNIEDIEASTSDIIDLTFYTFYQGELRDDAGARPVTGMVVSGDYFEVLGVEPGLGRLFDHDDKALGAHQEVVIGYALWQERFGGSPDVIGRKVSLGPQIVTIVGVTPEGFGGTSLFPAEVFVPYSAHREIMPQAPFFEQRRFLAFFPLARLHEGVSAEQVDAELGRVASNLAETYAVDNAGRTFVTVPLSHALIGPDQRGGVLAALALLMTAIGFVLLIACANAANLMLARAASRRAEIAVRRVLGATGGRIIRQMLTESLMLASVASLLGLLLALPMRDFMWGLQGPGAAALVPEIDGTVLLYLLGVTAATGLLFGLAPALRAAGVDLMTPLKEETTPVSSGRKRPSLRSGLVVLQVALSTVALIGAGLAWHSMHNARSVDLGFESEQLVLIDVDLGKVEGAEQALAARRADVLDAVTALPEVHRAAAASRAPLDPGGMQMTVVVDDRDADAEEGVLFHSVFASPGLFATLEQPLLEGRDFDAADGVEHPSVAIVNDAFVRRYWPSGGALGKTITLTFSEMSLEIVGVVADAKVLGPTEDPVAVVWLPQSQMTQSRYTVMARVDDPAAAMPGLETALANLGEDVSVSNVRPVATQIDAALFGQRSAALLLGTFGALALALASIGIYGMMTYTVRQRTREIGIRMALGARPRDVLSFVLFQAMALVVAGIGIGAVGALLLQQQLAELLFEVGPADPIAFGGATLAMALLSLGAGWLPARRATRIQPTAAMRDA